MTARIVAAVDDSPTGVPVRRTAEALGRIFGADVDVVTVVTPGETGIERAIRRAEGEPVERIVAELDAEDVLLGVLGARRLTGARRPTGHVVSAVIQATRTPVVVVPPEAPGRIDRIIVPVEGDDGEAEALGRLLSPCTRAGVAVVSLHVFTPETTPAFWEGWHDVSLWRDEFAARHAARGSVELRTGDVCAEVCAATATGDLVAVAWHQDLSPGRARVVRALLDRCTCPLLLVPDAA